MIKNFKRSTKGLQHRSRRKLSINLLAIAFALLGTVSLSFGLYLNNKQQKTLQNIIMEKGLKEIHGPILTSGPTKHGRTLMFVASKNKGVYHFNCKAFSRICEAKTRGATVTYAGSVVHLNAQMYWPVVGTFTPGGALHLDQSENLYSIFSSEERSIAKQWIRDSVVFFSLSSVFWIFNYLTRNRGNNE